MTNLSGSVRMEKNIQEVHIRATKPHMTKGVEENILNLGLALKLAPTDLIFPVILMGFENWQKV